MASMLVRIGVPTEDGTTAFPTAQRRRRGYCCRDRNLHVERIYPDLDGKIPGWYECETLYRIVVTIQRGTKPLCFDNGASGILCEPTVAATITEWTIPDYKVTRYAHDHLNLAKKFFVRSENNATTCDLVEQALRNGVSEFRIWLASRYTEDSLQSTASA